MIAAGHGRQHGLRRGVGEAHRLYTNVINARGRWTGRLFQSRFASDAMDEDHLMTAVRYVSLNPVRARLVARAQDWPWSSVRAHLAGRDDGLVTVRSVLERVSDFSAWLRAGENNDYTTFRSSEGTGRPLCAHAMFADLERVLGRPIARRAAGRKPNTSGDPQPRLF